MSGQANPSSKKFRAYIKRFFDFKSWVDFNRTKEITNYFLNIFEKFFVPKKIKPEQVKSFDEVMQELGLTEEDIKKRSLTFQRMYRLMLGGALFFYVYTLYQFLYGSILSVMVAFVLAFLSLTLAFRYHFWFFQIQRRKLGCSIKEWFRANFMEGGQ